MDVSSFILINSSPFPLQQIRPTTYTLQQKKRPIIKKVNPRPIQKLPYVKFVKLQPLSSSRLVTNGVSPKGRHPFICLSCRKYRLPSNLFFQQEKQTVKYCKCTQINQLKKRTFITSDYDSLLGTLSPVGQQQGFPTVVQLNKTVQIVLNVSSSTQVMQMEPQIQDSSFNVNEIQQEKSESSHFESETRNQQLLQKMPDKEIGCKVQKREIQSKKGVNIAKSQSEMLNIGLKTIVKYYFNVVPGNNSEIVRKIMLKKGWVQNEKSSHQSHFVWHPTSKTVRFDRLQPYLQTQITNHFESHQELSNKLVLYKNLRNYSQSLGLKVTDFMPITFEIDFQSARYHSQILKFSTYFKSLSSKPPLKQTKFEIPPTTHFSGLNIWILKPTSYNRGRGIHLFNNLQTFKEILTSYQEISKSHPRKTRRTTYDVSKTPSLQLVIQKYIQKPLLYKNRKFDIRGYLRTSSQVYSADESSLEAEFIHLTNNAVQKKGESYGSFQKGNQVSFEEFRIYLEQLQAQPLQSILQQIKSSIGHSLSAVSGRLNPNKKQHCFQIFGYDFIMDASFQAWLIECNTNPCLELSSPLLERLIPLMLDQAFQLTIDRVFPPYTQPDLDNFWEFLTQISNQMENSSNNTRGLRQPQASEINTQGFYSDLQSQLVQQTSVLQTIYNRLTREVIQQ